MSTKNNYAHHKEEASSQDLKKLSRELKQNLTKILDLFERIIDFNHNPTNETAKRKLDVEIERLKALKLDVEVDTVKVDPFFDFESGYIQDYDQVYVKAINNIAYDLQTFKKALVRHIEEKTITEQMLSKENMKLKLELQKETGESMHQRQKQEYAIAEKNTVLATCRKLEEQLEERSKQIQQLQKEGTVSLWQREKAKLVQNINSNQEQLSQELVETKELYDDTKARLQRRIQELSEQVKLLKMEKDIKNGVMRRHFPGGNVPRSDIEALKRQVFMAERTLVVAEGELQRQQKYVVGFLAGLSRDFRIMLERQQLTVKDYNKDQKAFASMLNKMYVAVKDGTLTDFRASLPSHYLGINVDLTGHPLGKKLTRPFQDLEQHLQGVENTEYRVDINHPLLTGWREGRTASDVMRKKKISAQITGVHPQLVDKNQKKPLFKEALEHFPEMSEKYLNNMFQLFKRCDTNDDLSLDTQELLRAIPDILGRMATTEEIKEAMIEVDIDSNGTVDFYEFLCVARMLAQGKGDAALFKKKTLKALQKPTATSSGGSSSVCAIQ